MRTLDQIRAEFAWGRVQNPSKEYRGLAKSLPALVMTNGLMQALAFLEGKGKPDHKRLLADVLTWLSGERVRVLPPEGRGFRPAMECLAKMPALEYQRATEEAQAILKWIRQLADTLSPGEGP
jgi:CRISPR-associated protein Cmr5